MAQQAMNKKVDQEKREGSFRDVYKRQIIPSELLI